MRWKDSVEAAKNGEQNAFAFLYEQTYGRCRYIAGKYLKDDTDAVNDVLQDAYVKTFQNIGQLEDPEKFPGWLATIVTNTALNELKKRKPLLFSQISDEDQNLDFTDNLEDDRVDTQPELSMDQAETKRLVQEMLEALSDEQRVCILMYYMEEKSVKEIAQILAVSENTVKSRLSYGRKAVKEKVLDLEKWGTKLYGLLPFPFFLYLFGMEAKACSVKGITTGLAGVMNVVNLTQGSVSVSTAALGAEKAGRTAVTKSAIGKASAGTVKAAVAGGVKVKVAAGVLAVGVAVGGTATVVHVVEEKKEPKQIERAVETETVSAEEEKIEDIVWEKYECQETVAAWGTDVLDIGRVFESQTDDDGALRWTNMPAELLYFYERPKVQIEDNVFTYLSTTVDEVVKAFSVSPEYDIRYGNGKESLNSDSIVDGEQSITVSKYDKMLVSLSFVKNLQHDGNRFGDYVLSDVAVSAVADEKILQNIWFQGGMRMDGGGLSCGELEQVLMQCGIESVEDALMVDEAFGVGMSPVANNNGKQYYFFAYTILDDDESFSFERYLYRINYDAESQMITKISCQVSSSKCLRYQKYKLRGKDDQYFSYFECGDYRTELTEKQKEVDVVEHGSLYMFENGMDVEQEQEPVTIATDASSLNYEGTIQFAENNGDGTYLCYVKGEDQCYTLSVADDARMLMVSFSEGVDENCQFEIPGADFKELPWGFDTSYGNFALYDFYGEFWGDAVIENGEIVSFDQYFRE